MDRAFVRAVRRRARAKPSALYFEMVRPDWRNGCGCVMGARCLAAALIISTVWYAWQWQSSSLSIEAALVRVLVWSFLAAAVGKTVAAVAASRKRGQTNTIPYKNGPFVTFGQASGGKVRLRAPLWW
jgi:hypothetical protein